jgi:hypothetical protein
MVISVIKNVTALTSLLQSDVIIHNTYYFCTKKIKFTNKILFAIIFLIHIIIPHDSHIDYHRSLKTIIINK